MKHDSFLHPLLLVAIDEAVCYISTYHMSKLLVDSLDNYSFHPRVEQSATCIDTLYSKPAYCYMQWYNITLSHPNVIWIHTIILQVSLLLNALI
jgi:hypothetical protein